MSDYEYRDADGARLNVDSYAANINAYVTDKGFSIGVLITNEDTPAVALAILEAAGWGDSEDRKKQLVLTQLRFCVSRKAEDTKAAKWWDETQYGHTCGAPWVELSEGAKTTAREHYRRHLEHFRHQADDVGPHE